MAPRVARMAQRGIKEETKKPSVTVAHAKPVALLTNDNSEPVDHADAGDPFSDNVTKALSEAKDPYDPAKPNDYQAVVEERIRRREEEERAMREEDEREAQALAARAAGPKASKAEQILKKMGWKGKGYGLGKRQQGISTALVVQKTGVTQGVIINTDARRRELAPDMEPSPVVVLRNMVGPGEVDANLRFETAQECTKYGEVRECEVYESETKSPEEAVRIFVQFANPEQALQALVDLDGRFFARREVRADYYPLEKFQAKQYNEPL